MTCAFADPAVPRRLLGRPPAYVSRQPVANPAQPSPAQPCWNVLRGQALFVSSLLSSPMALFGQVCPGLVQQTLPAQRLLGKRSWRKAWRLCPAPCPILAGGAVTLLGGMVERPGVFRAIQGLAPGLWPPESPPGFP